MRDSKFTATGNKWKHNAQLETCCTYSCYHDHYFQIKMWYSACLHHQNFDGWTTVIAEVWSIHYAHHASIWFRTSSKFMNICWHFTPKSRIHRDTYQNVKGNLSTCNSQNWFSIHEFHQKRKPPWNIHTHQTWRHSMLNALAPFHSSILELSRNRSTAAWQITNDKYSWERRH